MCCLWHTHERTHEQKKSIDQISLLYSCEDARNTGVWCRRSLRPHMCHTRAHFRNNAIWCTCAPPRTHELCVHVGNAVRCVIFYILTLSLSVRCGGVCVLTPVTTWSVSCGNAQNVRPHTHKREHARAKWTNLIKLDLTAWHGQTHARVHTCAHEFTSTGTKHRPQRVCVRNRERANIAGFFAQIKRPDLSWVGGTHTRSCFRVVFLLLLVCLSPVLRR